MRRLLLPVCMLAAVAALLAGPATAAPGDPPGDPARGLVYDGMRRSPGTGACRGNFELDDLRDGAGRTLCTHGPDPAPPGVDVRNRRDPRPATAPATAAPSGGTAAADTTVCDGDGSGGYRVQLLYIHAADVADRYSSLRANFQQWAATMDRSFSASAAETGGDRHVRFVHDASCNVVVTDVSVSTTGDDAFNNTVSELRKKGYTRSDRKYVAWVDANRYCGIGQVYYDDSAGPGNASNGVSSVQGEVARIDNGCWGEPSPVEAHELMHTLGGVQTSAPHATTNNHCTDESDRMCYPDASGVQMTYPCPSSHEALFDCNHDDYYTTSPRAGSYLATHWNTADNVFLVRTGSGTGTTGSTSTTVGPTGTVPSAPQGLTAVPPSSGKGVALSWQPPASPGSGPVTSYRIFRGTSATKMPVLVTVSGSTTSYVDTGTVSGRRYYYQVMAVSSAGKSPRSTVAQAVAG
jgi:hypothetical protein